MDASLDFAYPWWLSHAHLVVAAVMGAFCLLAYSRKWSKWIFGLSGIITVWATVAFLLIRFGVNINSVPPMPTENFLRAGTGRVLDLGAGTGRSSIMVLRGRPEATLVALDLFGKSFDQHFGHTETPQDRLFANAKAANVDQRLSVVTSDMRKLPFADATFDGIISSYAIDHLGRDGIKQTLGEACRVLRPGGVVLLLIINGHDPWLRFAFGPLLARGGFGGASGGIARREEPGLHVPEAGNRPAPFY